jgi:peroxiredoxin (alkyl hydroperoxide reductase subunit C)
LIYYPLNNGRNMKEIVRVIDAFQTSDKHGVATPANWHPGDDVIVPPPKTTAQAEKRLAEGYDCADWFFCKKKL